MTSTFSKRGALAVCTLLGGSFIASGAFAETPDTSAAPSITVEYTKLELAQPDGVADLYRRIASAARQVCQEPGRLELTRYARYRQCFDQAVDSAVSKVDVPQLSALHRTRMQRNIAG